MCGFQANTQKRTNTLRNSIQLKNTNTDSCTDSSKNKIPASTFLTGNYEVMLSPARVEDPVPLTTLCRFELTAVYV